MLAVPSTDRDVTAPQHTATAPAAHAAATVKSPRGAITALNTNNVAASTGRRCERSARLFVTGWYGRSISNVTVRIPAAASRRCRLGSNPDGPPALRRTVRFTRAGRRDNRRVTPGEG